MPSLFIHAGLLLIFLAGVFSLDHLSWKECLRLLIIDCGLLAIYFRYRHKLEAPIEELKTQSKYLNYGGIVLALVVIFTITQFDPATSTLAFRERVPRSNLFFLISTGFSLAIGVIFLFGWYRRIRWSNLNVVDRIVLCLVSGVLVISIGAEKFLGTGIGHVDLWFALKLISYLLLWFAVTRVYAQIDWSWQPLYPLMHFLADRWKAPLLVFSLLCVVALIDGGYRTWQVVYHSQMGKQAFQANALEDALMHYELAHQFNRTVDLAFIREQYLSDLATLYLRQGNSERARQTITELEASTYEKDQLQLQLANIYERAEQWKSAANAYETYLENAGKDIAVLDRLGRAYLALRDTREFVEMVSNFQYIPKIEAQTYDEQIFLGNLHFHLGNWSHAQEYYEAAARLNPQDGYAQYKVGRTLQEMSRQEQAMKFYRNALELEPDFADAYYRLGICFEKQGNKAEAIKMYQKAVELLPNHLDGLLALQRVLTN